MLNSDPGELCCPCQQGPVGPPGPAGDDGEPGYDGQDGQDGSNGRNGLILESSVKVLRQFLVKIFENIYAKSQFLKSIQLFNSCSYLFLRP